MKLNEKKSVVTGISLVTILGIVATCIGLFADVRDLFGSDEKISQSSVAEVQETNQIENSEENNNQIEIPEESTSIENSEENNNQIEISEESTSIEISEEEIIPPTPTSSKTKLCDMKVVESWKYNSEISQRKDTIGNIYSGNITIFDKSWYSSTDGGYTVYYLGRKYKTLTGIIAVDDESSNDCTTILNILGDENLLYTTGELSRTSVPIEISINVEGIEWLRINRTSFDISVILYNWVFE